MFDEQVVRTIDALRAGEECSLLQRLAESETFVPTDEIDEFNGLAAMLDDERRHVRQLAELLDALAATPGPRRVQAWSGGMHYNKPHVLIPQLIADKKRLIAEYEAAAPAVAHVPQAAELVAANLARHRSHLAKLEALLHPSDAVT